MEQRPNSFAMMLSKLEIISISPVNPKLLFTITNMERRLGGRLSKTRRFSTRIMRDSRKESEWSPSDAFQRVAGRVDLSFPAMPAILLLRTFCRPTIPGRHQTFQGPTRQTQDVQTQQLRRLRRLH